MSDSRYLPVCNDTKWLELRACILSSETRHWPEFRSKCLSNGYISSWDDEWHYHFINGGFKDVEWFELRLSPLANQEMISGILEIGLVVERQESAIRAYGYVPVGSSPRKLIFEDFDNVPKHLNVQQCS